MTKRPLLWIVALSLLLTAFALRVHGLDRYDFWYDETTQITAATQPTLAEMFTVIRRHHAASPLNYLVLRAVYGVTGHSEFTLRFVSLIWSMGAVALVFQAARVLTGGLALPFWSALYAAISPFAIRYAQEARFYALSLMLASAVLYVALFAAKHPHRRTPALWVTLALLTAGTAYAQILAVLIALPALLAAVATAPAQSRVHLLKWQITAFGLGGLLFLPWYVFGLRISAHPFGTSALDWFSIHQTLSGLEVLPLFMNDAGGIEGAYRGWLVLSSVLAVWFALAFARRHPWGLALLVGVLACAALIAWNNLRVNYFFTQRQFLFLLPARAILIGAGMTYAMRMLLGLGRSGVLKPAAVGLSLALVALSAAYANADLHRAERSHVRAAAQFLAEHLRTHPASSEVFCVPLWTHRTLNYYLTLEGVNVQWSRVPGDRITPEAIAALRQRPQATLVLPRQDADVLPTLEQAGFEIAFPPPGFEPTQSFLVLLKRQ